MPYILKKIFDDLKTDITELNRVVISLSTQPDSLERDTHIEGCFIRLVVTWECFIEEYFLRCMCKAKTRTNQEIKPLGVASRNTNEAFKRINKNRKDRDKDFTDWLDAKTLQQRINDLFRSNSRVQKICEAPEKMFELLVIRNAIAHRSSSAIAKFERHVKDQIGYLSPEKPSMAALLIKKKRNSNELIFTTLSNYFHSLADKLTK